MPWRFHEIPSSNAISSETSPIRPNSTLFTSHWMSPATDQQGARDLPLLLVHPHELAVLPKDGKMTSDRSSMSWRNTQNRNNGRCLKRKARAATATSHWSWQDLWRAGYTIIITVSLQFLLIAVTWYAFIMKLDSMYLTSASANRSCLTTRNWNLQESSSEIATPSHWKQSTWNIAQEKTRSSCERHQDFLSLCVPTWSADVCYQLSWSSCGWILPQWYFMKDSSSPRPNYLSI